MLWFLLALASPIFWAVTNVLDSILRRHHVHNDVTLMWSYAFFRLPMALIMAWIFGAEWPGAKVGLGMLGVGMLWTLMFIPYLKALSLEETSRVALFLQLLSPFTLVLGFLMLGESLNAEQGAAFFLLMAGGVTAGIKHHGERWRLSAAFWLMVMAAFFWGFSDVVFKQLAPHFSSFGAAFTLFLFGSFLPSLVLPLTRRGRTKLERMVKHMTLRGWALLFTSLTLGVAGSILFAYALILGKVALTSAITQIQPLVVFLLGWGLSLWFREVTPEDLSASALLLKGLSFALLAGGLALLYF